MTRKKIKPARVARPAPSALASSRRFALVRVSDRTIEAVNLDRILIAVFRVLPEGDDVEINLWTETESARSDGDGDPIRFTGKPAADVLAHLAMIGMHVEGAADHLLAAPGGELFAPYFAPLDKLDEDRDDLGDRPECEGCGHVDHGCPDGFTPDASGACSNWRPVECADCARDENTCPGFEPDNEDGGLCANFADSPASLTERRSRSRVCAACVHEEGCTAYLEPGETAGHCSGFLGRTGARIDAADLGPIVLAPAELRAGEADAARPPSFARLGDDARAALDATRDACAFGEKCQRFPACGDCSLYALDRACATLHDGGTLDTDGGERRRVHVEHVEEVSGETSAALLARVNRCGVFLGMKRANVTPGDKWCGVGHEMTDPACALCPYLRIYAPAAPIASR